LRIFWGNDCANIHLLKIRYIKVEVRLVQWSLKGMNMFGEFKVPFLFVILFCVFINLVFAQTEVLSKDQAQSIVLSLLGGMAENVQVNNQDSNILIFPAFSEG
jgi:hypothetical protein